MIYSSPRPLHFAIPLLIGCSVAGCAPVNREQLSKDVLKADPAFADVLSKHRDLTSRIATFESQLQLKRTTAQKHIAQLRDDLAKTASSLRAKVAETKLLMDPDRKRLGLALEMAGEELRAKRAQRASLGRQIARLRKLAVGKDGMHLSAQERRQHEAQLTELLQDAARLDQELTGLKEHVRLLRLKLLLIRF